MKVLIQGNCSLRTHVTYYQDMFPDWDVRGVLVKQANSWLEDGHEAFSTFVGSVDLFIGLTDRGLLMERIPATATVIRIPAFDFFGYHPDCVRVSGTKSPLINGSYHSRIIASCYFSKMSQANAQEMLNGKHYEHLGYFNEFETNKQYQIDRFKKAVDVDLTDLFAEWSSDGCFMYCPPHAENKIFFDVCHAVARAGGLVDDSHNVSMRQARTNVANYLGDGIIWPIYSEVAEALEISQNHTTWRFSKSKGTGEHMTENQFIHASYQTYDAMDQATKDKMLVRLGGSEGIALASGNY